MKFRYHIIDIAQQLNPSSMQTDPDDRYVPWGAYDTHGEASAYVVQSVNEMLQEPEGDHLADRDALMKDGELATWRFEKAQNLWFKYTNGWITITPVPVKGS